MKIPGIPRGTFCIIRVDGTEEWKDQKPTIPGVHSAIGCESVDTVTLDRDAQTIMMVDDIGVIDGKPVNPKATALMKVAFGPQYPNPICGDVALVNDEDFA